MWQFGTKLLQFLTVLKSNLIKLQTYLLLIFQMKWQILNIIGEKANRKKSIVVNKLKINLKKNEKSQEQ